MTSHIPPDKLLPQDLVDIYDRGPADGPHPAPVVIRMHASDARHAMDVEPERYTLNLAAEQEPGMAALHPDEPAGADPNVVDLSEENSRKGSG